MAQRAVARPLQFPPRPLTALSEPIRIPLSTPKVPILRYASLENRDQFGSAWRTVPLMADASESGFYQIDVSTLGLPDGTYEYDFQVDLGSPGAPKVVTIPDPFARDLVKFGGYRSVFLIESGKRVTEPFAWDEELPQGVTLPNNNQMVIYEMPVRWMAVATDNSEVDLGTFDKLIFEHLDDLRSLGINAIELLPCQDSQDTMNWGYGTRFFFSPDYDMGTPIDVRYFVNRCHQYGIRVLLDIVMNHSRACPLETLAHDRYYLADGEEPERNGWGGQRFRYRNPIDGKYLAREFQYNMAKFWIREYHIDGFRIDEFRGINNWDFLQEFRNQAWMEHNRLFPKLPFVVIAEDSSRNPQITHDQVYNGDKLADSMWNFDFRDEVRRIMNNSLQTNWGEPSRSDRIRNAISGARQWDDWTHSYRSDGFTDLSQAVNYVTSHDVAGYTEQRLMNYYMSQILRYENKDVLNQQNKTETVIIRELVDSIASQPPDIQAIHAQCLERIGGTFALMLTSCGIPMFLAGEEFGDVHDKEPSDPGLKQEDPVNWERENYFGHNTLRNRIQQLIALRTAHPALQRNEIDFFYFHPTMDENYGERVFAYRRTGGQTTGTAGQVFVIANAGGANYPQYYLPWKNSWPGGNQLREWGQSAGAMNPQTVGSSLLLSLAPFQVRVFAT